MNTKPLFQVLVITAIVLTSVSTANVSALSPVLYVVQGGSTSGSCDSWANACDLQYALTSAVSGQEIWVAAGVYKPTTDPTDRAATFQLMSGVGLYGGFAGTETARDQRNWQTNKTVFSGDIDNNDINDDGNFIAETMTDVQGENSNHVIFCNNQSDTLLDGFIVTAGKSKDSGGGIYNLYCDLNLVNVTFSGNTANNGGGIFNVGHLTLTNIAFLANYANQSGGGMYDTSFSRTTLKNITFASNSASYQGGGSYNDNATETLINVNFLANSASDGGGMFITNGSGIDLTNIIFYANEANYGGGLYSFSSRPSLTNTTFHNNSASKNGGGIYSHYNSQPVLINSVLWGDNAPIGSEIALGWWYSSISVTNSIVQGSWPGKGNIDADPLFVDAANGDLHLQASSPALDSGTNTGCPAADFDGVIRPQDGNNDGVATCDMGAFEYIVKVIPVEIDLKPGSYPNPINLGSKGVTPVAVLTTDDFDASDLDPATVVFAGAFPLRWTYQDADWDGDMDLLFHFNTLSLKLDQTSTDAMLTGKTFDGMAVEGKDSVKIVPNAAEITPTDLGTLGGLTSYPIDINNRGQVIGYSQATYDPTIEDFLTHPFLWDQGQMIDLGTIGGGYSAQPWAINDSGQIVGESQTIEGYSHAFLWENGAIIDLGTLGGSQSAAYDINDSGQIAGFAWTSEESTHAVLWDKANVIDLGALGGDYSVALKINNSGQIIGASNTVDGQFHAFLWEDGTMIDITPPGAESSWPFDINNKGQVIGIAYMYDPSGNSIERPFLREKGKTFDLSTIGGRYSAPMSINEMGRIVGLAWDESDLERATLWEKGEIIVIGPIQPTYLTSIAYDINDAGQIIGDIYDQQLGIGQPVYWDKGTMYYLDKFPNGNFARPIAINNQGLIIGECEVEPGVSRACVWHK